MRKFTTISPKYAELNRQLHEAPRGFGGGGHNHVDRVLELVKKYNCGKVLDYGCGQGLLGAGLFAHDIFVVNYDPAVPEWSEKPTVQLFDLVVSTDVLEHVEPEYLENVLAELHSYTGKAAWLIIAFNPSGKSLADGRNAHLIQESPEWWEAKLEALPWRIADKQYVHQKDTGKVKKGIYLMEVDRG